MTRTLTAAIAFIVAVTCARGLSGQVTVYAWQENKPEGVMYHYRVVNPGPEGFLWFNIGDDELSGFGPRLMTHPVGLVEDEEAPIDGFGFPIPTSSVGVPSGWSASFLLPGEHVEGSSLHYSITDTGTPLRSATLRGFSILVPQAEATYMTGPWKGGFERGFTTHGTLQKDTTDAPAPAAAVTGSAQGCESVSLTMNAALTGNGPWSLRWSDGFSQQTEVPQVARTVVSTFSKQYWITSISDVNTSGTSSGVATATVNSNPPAPTVTTSGPTNFCPGGSVTLAAPDGYTYRWSTGATSQAIIASAAGNYSVTVTNAGGCSSTSAPAVVTVSAATEITQQPQSRTVARNTTATLTVVARGTGNLTYQWYKGTSPNTSSPISGATGSSYTTPKLARGAYDYWVRVSGSCGFLNSATARVTAN
ncbi:MAG TPA: hypothetical protein VF911_15890 [Thermoanaerobaculia bacterium]